MLKRKSSAELLLKRRGYLDRLRTPETEADTRRMERRLAYARASVAMWCLVVMRLAPTEFPSRHGLASLLLLAYMGYSLLIVIWMRLHPQDRLPHRFARHAIDVLAVSAFTVITEGPNDSAWVLFAFVLAGAAVSWGYWRTVATALCSSMLIFLGAPVLNRFFPDAETQDLPWSEIGKHTAYILIAGILIAILFEAAKRLSAERALIERLLGSIGRDGDFSGAMEKVCGEIARVFDSRKIWVVVREGPDGPAYLWHINEVGEPELFELGSSLKDVFFFTCEECCCFMDRTKARRCLLRAIGAVKCRDLSELPRPFPGLEPFESLLVVSRNLGRGTVRAFFLDPAPSMRGPAGMRLAVEIMQRGSGPMYDLYLLWRLNGSIGERERERVACELHDGPVQSLQSMELRLETLRRKMSASQPDLSRQLELVQRELREEIVQLREFMTHLRPVQVEPGHFVDVVHDMAGRFQSATGIRCIVSGAQQFELPVTTLRDLIRVVQEALINVRKHSGADSVEISLDAQNGACRVIVTDNGCGMGFNGTFTQAELEACARGPQVLRERVRLIGGELSIASTPGKGTRLEITVPREAYGKTDSDSGSRNADALPCGTV
jgi:two-component sensor histidine kinase